MTKDITNINEKITKASVSLLTITATLLIGTITYIFLNLDASVTDLNIENKKLQQEVIKLHSAISLQTLSLQVIEDRTKENEREIRELIRISYEKRTFAN